MIKQFRELKKKYPERLFLFRRGDFYVAYGQDAQDAVRILGITLQKDRRCNEFVAMFPNRELYDFLPRLIRAGHGVATVEQQQTSAQAKKLIADFR